MPYPTKGESKQDYIAEFMKSDEARKDYPDQKQRAAVAYSIWEDRKNANDAKWEDLPDDEKEAMLKILSEPAKPRSNDVVGPRMSDVREYAIRLIGTNPTRMQLETELKKRYPDADQAIIDTVMHDVYTGRRNSRGQMGHIVPMRFIEPGLVHYSDVGTVLVRKETLDKMLPSIVGKPIFNESHKEVTDDDFTDGKAQGIVAGNPRFNPGDGWFWVDGLIWDDETRKNCKDGYSLSCAYDVTRWGDGGVHNNIPYDREVLAGEYTHLAIVNNPRYEGARLIINQGGLMKLKFWEKDKPTEPKELELVNSVVTLAGQELPMEKVLELAGTEQKRQDELKNAKLTDESIVEVGGKKMSVKEAKDLAAKALKNADDEKEKKAKEDEERKNAEAKEKEEKEKKEKEEMENRKNEDEHEKGEHKDKPMENCLACKADAARKNARHFEDLRNARDRGQGEFREPSLKTVSERVAEGAKRYGAK